MGELFTVVGMNESHIKEVAELEKECFSEPWSEVSLLESLKTGTKFFVALQNSSVIGYIGIKPVLDEGYITNVAVSSEKRGKGVGTQLLNNVTEFAASGGLSFVTLEVRASNSRAVSLYEKNGFKAEGRRRNFYRFPSEDAIIMTKRF